MNQIYEIDNPQLNKTNLKHYLENEFSLGKPNHLFTHKSIKL
jgi:hypothetical protein